VKTHQEARDLILFFQGIRAVFDVKFHYLYERNVSAIVPILVCWVRHCLNIFVTQDYYLSGPQETGTDPVFIYIHSGYTLQYNMVWLCGHDHPPYVRSSVILLLPLFTGITISDCKKNGNGIQNTDTHECLVV
jgi:hypothetical protein